MSRTLPMLLAALLGAAGHSSLPAAEDFGIDIGISGTWYTPEFPGQGLLIDVITSSEQLFVAWFVYKAEDDTTPETTLIADEQRWYVAQGGYSGDSADLPLFSTTGGRFNAGDAVSLVEAGAITISFADCNEGQIEVLFDGDEESTVFPIQRLTEDFNCRRQFPDS